MASEQNKERKASCTLARWVDGWKDWMKHEGYDSNTISKYVQSMDCFLEFCEYKNVSRVSFNTAKIDLEFFNDWLKWQLEQKELSASSVNTRLNGLRNYFKFVRYYHAETDCSRLYFDLLNVSTIRRPPPPDEYLNNDRISLLMSAFPDTRIGHKNRFMVLFMYITGVRANELISLTVGDLHLDGDMPYLHIHGEFDQQRDIRLDSDMIEQIRIFLKEQHGDVLNPDDPLFFVNRKGERARTGSAAVLQILKTYSHKLQKDHPDFPAVNTLLIRRSCAERLYEDGVPVEAIALYMGHNSLVSTTRVIDHNRLTNARSTRTLMRRLSSLMSDSTKDSKNQS
ncbi:tyrosine-type recombinase/integrase [Anaerobiospirillum sp. NML120449]|uniref:tyrosine-type recombinase/integrase n=1 Tax=Anaerobiospirillum sp. NML120449 TaxID=2932817 RepID=UPI001FF16E4C|nr:tyrosine-type recombinase/integrase [Anaerobiospirillum sp. NML120449]MCK0526439.1 site-specific integrase [Anaerobiospirillum sp. NML120449]